MPRIGRVVAIGCPHHITQRGNYQQKVFEGRNDYLRYISWINDYSEKYDMKIAAYCLMTNHMHFIAIPNKKDSLSRTFNYTHMRYTQYKNTRKEASGHLWQGRFYSCILDENHLIEAIRYVERNPVRAKLVKDAWGWEWSSAGEHVGIGKSRIPLVSMEETKGLNKEEWKEYLAEEEQEEFNKDIRIKTTTGRPLGSERFVRNLEEEFKTRLIALPRGRQKAKQNK